MSDVRSIAAAARRAGASLAREPGPHRRAVLLALADALARPSVRATVLTANADDVQDATERRDRGELAASLVDRLVLDGRKLDGLCEGLGILAAQRDLVGNINLVRDLDEGLVLRRVTCPLGVVGVVFEARPDAVPQIVGLCLRTANACVLKGGHEARRSVAALVQVIRDTLIEHGDDPYLVGTIEARHDVTALVGLRGLVDLVIARGGAAFVREVQRRAEVPVLGHAEGLCHLVLHASAAPEMAAAIAVDAKCSYPAACNAIETLLWQPGAEAALDACVTALKDRGVELRGCERTRALHPALPSANERDWDTEYGAPILAVRGVDDLDAAIDHVARHGSGHTETIVAEDERAAAAFIAGVDAAAVFHNASSRFCDGFRFGLGAEVGVSTSKLHARGPVGAEGLLTYRWLLRGEGQVASDYGPNGRKFLHRDR